MRENRIEKALVRAVKERGGLCWKFVSPGTRGVPDRIVLTPDGRTVYVETKAPGRQLSPLQNNCFVKLRKRGHRVEKIDSIEQVDRFVKEIFGDEV